MKLYYSDVLSPRKVCALARYLQLPLEYEFLDLARGEQMAPAYLALNPNGKVPTLVDGGSVLWEADAINVYLALQAGSSLWPQGARQVEVMRWFSWGMQHFNRHAGALYFECIIKARFGIGAPDATVVAEALQQFRRFATVLDAHLRDHAWLVGDTLSLADFSVAVSLPYADRAQLPLDDFAHMRRWHRQLCQFDAWREPFPARAPDG